MRGTWIKSSWSQTFEYREGPKFCHIQIQVFSEMDNAFYTCLQTTSFCIVLNEPQNVQIDDPSRVGVSLLMNLPALIMFNKLSRWLIQLFCFPLAKRGSHPKVRNARGQYTVQYCTVYITCPYTVSPSPLCLPWQIYIQHNQLSTFNTHIYYKIIFKVCRFSVFFIRNSQLSGIPRVDV